jgi:hypothetical protein
MKDFSHLVARRIPWSPKFSDGDYVAAANRGEISPESVDFLLRTEWWALGPRLAVCVDPEEPDSILVKVKGPPPMPWELAAAAQRFLRTDAFEVAGPSYVDGDRIYFLAAD